MKSILGYYRGLLTSIKWNGGWAYLFQGEIGHFRDQNLHGEPVKRIREGERRGKWTEMITSYD